MSSRNDNQSSRGEGQMNWRKGGGSSAGGPSRSVGYGNRSGGDSWRGGSGSSASGSRFAGSNSSGGERPRLNLKPRGGATASGGGDAGETKLSKMSLKDGRDDTRRGGAPPPVNSRAAAFGSAPEVQTQSLRPRDNRGERGQGPTRGPPPVTNQRMAQMADEERENRREREMQRKERGPPEPIGSSRFAPPPGEDRMRGAPPREPQGPPPIVNSRFAAAAKMAKEDEAKREQERTERAERGDGPPSGGPRFGGAGPGRYADRGPPPPQNSRFAAAAAADSDYGDRGGDDRGPRGPGGPPGGPRFGGPGRGGGYGGDRRDDRRGFGGPRDYGDLPRGPRGSSMNDLPRGPRSQMDDLPRGPRSSGVDGPTVSSSRVDDLLKPKKPVAADNILKAPAKAAPEHEQNMLQFPAKALSKDDEDVLAPPKKEKAAESEPETPATPSVDPEKAEELLNEFASGSKLGDALKSWVEENRASLPPVDQLVFKMLEQQEKLNPDPECGWAQPTKFGAALLALVEEDVVGQMQVLWGIQFYCDSIGFPKFNEEYIVQAMFRGAYKFDLADDDAFAEWKDDETEAFEKGKLKAIIQTVEWFNWLEEEDEESEEDGEEEAEE